MDRSTGARRAHRLKSPVICDRFAPPPRLRTRVRRGIIATKPILTPVHFESGVAPAGAVVFVSVFAGAPLSLFFAPSDFDSPDFDSPDFDSPDFDSADFDSDLPSCEEPLLLA